MSSESTQAPDRKPPAAAHKSPAAVRKPSAAAQDIVFDHVVKTYPNSTTPAVDDLSLTVPAGEICVLLGPSGSGKTTALMMVNRLAELTGGDIRIGERSIMDHDPIKLRRSIGYVIQQTGLFPHLTIADNIATVPKVLGWDKKRVKERVSDLLELVGLPPGEYGKRYPSQLSGGQRQRVGIARALAADPPVMLMDEPFGALDPITREHVQDEFLALHERIRKTVIFVSHDIDEAVKMGDRIAIFREGGKLAQYDTPRTLLKEPADAFVARFVGADRGLKRLTLTKLADLDLDPAPTDQDTAQLPALTADASLRAALSLMVAEGTDAVRVTGPEAAGENKGEAEGEAEGKAEGEAEGKAEGEAEVLGLATLDAVRKAGAA
ncbi:ABC transporter ATP-binding protein [Streptomyces sp. NBC_01187]|uniref:ABC transporter ATP-binding protein n=1 Tax=Streptomyces sp. NBC_01187 TaxID=2903766 RepID=UPI0038684F28|nr:ABC transporter ATP-binding protein [Streptomyces sp. NBC_01187]